MERTGNDRNFGHTTLSSEPQLTVWAARPDVSHPVFLN